MQTRWRQWWPIAKGVLALAILGGVGWHFARLLRSPELWERPLTIRADWLELAAALYIVGYCFSLLYWRHLLRVMGEQPGWGTLFRAYFVGHLGKYAPGKAWALVLRTSIAHAGGVRAGVAALTSVYETLTMMAAGAMLAFVLFTIHAAEESDRWQAIGLLALAGIPILPGVFNRVVDKLTAIARKRVARQQGLEGETDAAALPRLRAMTLLRGLGLTSMTWLFLGLSLWATVQAFLPETEAFSFTAWSRLTSFNALAYVAGFLALPAPGGLGVREVILQRLLSPELSSMLGPEQGPPLAVVIVLALRLLWTAAEVLMAGLVCCPWSIILRPFLPSPKPPLPTVLPEPVSESVSETDH